ncbi:uncharacterized protein PITG_00319 [Phytophthora infestans T30-4]|uniref:Ubiquitin-like protease family profile domain-containing protein n=1 Tax=Phytophthora infestans (strain T30-4) TaxID=403677 RepID=D0MQH9_PHYIT|nr:uncharacterized protein PITG_00319 [Phytophthora infestans T30-4]EEY57748.1 conserved hypothetical protein [Phytophthora infestans T30-4]|eukprot:XP_002908934.1 conserved hypothetical protein [Phytophthora infestans T30-4]
MAMSFIWSLVHACREGMLCYSWLMSKVDEQFLNEGACALAKRMVDAWPFERLPGFGEGFDLDWTHLYCARSECWYHDSLINALMMTLAENFKNNTTLFLPPLYTPAPSKCKRIPPRTLSLVAAADKDLVFMPLNINGKHWVCLVLDRPRTTIYCYDSFDKRSNQIMLAELAEEIGRKALSDSDNCGLFIILHFWRRFVKEMGSDYTTVGLLRRRWDVLRTVVDFSDASKGEQD